MKFPNKVADTLEPVSWDQRLFRKYVLKLSIIVIGEPQIVRFLNMHSFLACFSNTPAAGTFHVGEKLILGARQINFITVIKPMSTPSPNPIEIFCDYVSIHHLEMGASQMPERKIH
jgi:hypothetical protein